MHHEYMKKQVQEWLKLSIVQPSRTHYNSPMFLVPKKDGGVRVVQDFRALNANSHWLGLRWQLCHLATLLHHGC